MRNNTADTPRVYKGPVDATLGSQFATALAAKDFDRVRALLHPEIDFRGMTPNRVWEATDPDTVITEILQQWFEPSDEIQSLDAALRPEALVLESTPLRPKKTDITIERVVLAWTPL